MKAHQGQFDFVKEHLDCGVSPDITNSKGVSLLSWACMGPQSRIAKLVLDAGAHPDQAFDRLKRTPLMHLCMKGGGQHAEAKLEIFEMLRARGAMISAQDVNGDTALSNAAAYDDPDLIKHLIAAGADVNHSGYQGMTPLMEAAQYGMGGNCLVLLEAGASLMKINLDDESAFSLAIAAGHVKTVAVLQSWIAREEARKALQELKGVEIGPGPRH